MKAKFEDSQVKWVTVLLTKAKHPSSYNHIFPGSTYDETTTSRYIVPGNTDLTGQKISLFGYGMGWFQLSHQGHPVFALPSLAADWICQLPLIYLFVLQVLWHTGSLPGISTLIGVLPEDGLGVVVLINTSEKGKQCMQIMYHLIDDALGLDSTQREHSSMETMDNNVSAGRLSCDERQFSATADEAVTPSDLMAMYEGTYFDSAYGEITLCSGWSMSSQCQDVLDDFAPFEKFGIPGLFAKLRRAWSSHVRLRRIVLHRFSASIFFLFPDGYGMNQTPFQDLRAAVTVEFLVTGSEWDGTTKVEGLGVILDDKMAEERARNMGSNSIKDIADVFFVKTS